MQKLYMIVFLCIFFLSACEPGLNKSQHKDVSEVEGRKFVAYSTAETDEPLGQETSDKLNYYGISAKDDDALSFEMKSYEDQLTVKIDPDNEFTGTLDENDKFIGTDSNNSKLTLQFNPEHTSFYGYIFVDGEKDYTAKIAGTSPEYKFENEKQLATHKPDKVEEQIDEKISPNSRARNFRGLINSISNEFNVNEDFYSNFASRLRISCPVARAGTQLRDRSWREEPSISINSRARGREPNIHEVIFQCDGRNFPPFTAFYVGLGIDNLNVGRIRIYSDDPFFDLNRASCIRATDPDNPNRMKNYYEVGSDFDDSQRRRFKGFRRDYQTYTIYLQGEVATRRIPNADALLTPIELDGAMTYSEPFYIIMNMDNLNSEGGRCNE